MGYYLKKKLKLELAFNKEKFWLIWVIKPYKSTTAVSCAEGAPVQTRL